MMLEFDARLRYASGFQVNVRFESDAPLTGLFGPSGSGKTSVLSMLAGLRKPDAGRIRLGDRILFDSRAGVNLAPEERRIGYVFQDHLLFPHLTVRKNLLYGWQRTSASAGREAGGIKALSPDRVIKVLDLSELLERYPHTLSGGQRQRVTLGRALLARPQLLLLDEPVASVDDERKEKVLDFILQALAEWPIPAVYVTHDAGELKRMASTVVRLHQGSVSAVGSPEEVLLSGVSNP